MTRQEAEKIKEFISNGCDAVDLLNKIDSLVEEEPKEQPKKIEKLDECYTTGEIKDGDHGVQWFSHEAINSIKINEIIDHLNGEA
jgi:hypothetical protein